MAVRFFKAFPTVHRSTTSVVRRCSLRSQTSTLDIVEHSDPAVRECERAALPWWLRQAELVLETGLV